MKDRTSDRPKAWPNTTNSGDGQRDLDGHHHGEPARRALSVVGDSAGENRASGKGTDDDKEIMAMYAAMLPRAHILGRITQRHLMIAGGVGLLLLGVAVARHLPASNAAAARGPSALAPSTVTPAPAVPAIPTAPAPTALAGPSNAGVAAALPPATPAPVPAKQSPSMTLAVVAPPVLVAAAQDAQAAPSPAPKPAAAAAASPGAAETDGVQGCRDAIKRRDHKAVSALCESALAADPSLAKPLLALAKVLFESGRAAKAAVWSRKIVQVNSSLAEAYLIIGVAEQEALNPAAARTAYQRYLQLAPTGTFADDVRSSLKSL